MLYSSSLLCVSYIVVCICQSQAPSFSLTSPLPLVTVSLFSTLLFCKSSIVPFLKNSAYIICYFSFSDLLHSIRQPLGPSMLLRMALFCSFHSLVPVNSSAMNVSVHVSFQISIFVFSPHVYPVSQSEKDKYCLISLEGGILKIIQKNAYTK